MLPEAKSTCGTGMESISINFQTIDKELDTINRRQYLLYEPDICQWEVLVVWRGLWYLNTLKRLCQKYTGIIDVSMELGLTSSRLRNVMLILAYICNLSGKGSKSFWNRKSRVKSKLI